MNDAIIPLRLNLFAMPTGRAGRWIAAVVLFATTLAGVQVDVRLSDALAARDAGRYPEAIAVLEKMLTANPERTDYELLLAETLAWDHRYDQAERHYRNILSRDARSEPAMLGLSRIFLWEGRYDDAIRELDLLLARNPANVDALEARATGDYWSGDFRSAERRFRAVLEAEPTREFAQKSLDEIDLASTPTQRVTIDDIDDDQPYRLTRSELEITSYSDPLTRWTTSIGTLHASSDRYGAHDLPFVRLDNETVLPRWRMTFNPSVGVVRYADGSERAVGTLGVSFRIREIGAIHLEAKREAMFRTASSLTTHPSVDSFGIGWTKETDSGWSASAHASRLRYFDGNRGTSTWAWALAPLMRRGDSRLRGGISASVMDTDETRFHVAAVASVRNGDGFDYTYRGEYAPYWTPRNLREARAIVVADARIGTVGIKLHGDWGFARDKAIAFGPLSGIEPLPVAVTASPFTRRFHPFRTELETTIPLGKPLTLQAGVEVSQTAFYRSRTVHVSLVRRH